MTRTPFSLAIAAAFAVTSAGCTLGPDFKPLPAPGAPDRVAVEPLPAATPGSEAPFGEAQRFLRDTPPAARWWEQYGSDTLNELVAAALRGSPTIASAQSALVSAQANARARYANLFPEASLNFNGTRQKIDFGSFGQPGGGSLIYNLFNASVGVSYGLDLWGGTRRGVEAERAAAEAREHELHAAYQTLIGNVVTSAITLAENRYLLKGARVLVDDQTRRVAIAEKQYALGAISRVDLAAEQSALAQAQVDLATLESQVLRSRTELGVFLGRAPSEAVAEDLDLMAFKLPTALPDSLPSAVVRQRPDLRAAEAGLHAAAARIGVATAAQLPQIALTANLGTQATKIGDLFSNNIWSIGSAITQPLFDAGERRALKEAAIADYQKTEADYRLTVLNAFKNVADTLYALQTNAGALAAYHDAVEAAELSRRSAERQLELGAGTRSEALRLHAEWVRANAGYANTVAARLRDTAALHVAVGGDWGLPAEPQAAADAPAPAAAVAATE